MNKFCYWSVADSEFGHDKMMAALIQSARAVGVKENFHTWADVSIPGAISHDSGKFKKEQYKFKIDILHSEVKKLFYEYFVFVDADSWFVRHPGDPTTYCRNSPIHVCLESNCDDPNTQRKDWWECPLPRFCELMREKGVRCSKIYNMNAGFWVIHRDAIDTLHRLCYEFWVHCENNSFSFTEEPPMAYAAHMMMGNPYKHTIRESPELWASDWLGHFKDRIPVDETWDFIDYLTMEPIKVQPAIVHAMRSKDQLKEIGNGIV